VGIFVRWARLVSLLLLLLLGARNAAGFPSSRLVYARGPGAEGCPEQAAVREAVKKRLGYDPFFPSADKTIILRVAREPNGLRGEVELVDEHGTEVGHREFTAPTEQCMELVRAMALSVSIAIDPKSAETYGAGPEGSPALDAAENGQEVPGNAVPEPTAVPLQRLLQHASTPPVRMVPAAPAWRGSGGLGGTLPLRSLPDLTIGASAFAAIRKDRWSLAMEGELDLPGSTRVQGVELRSSSFALKVLPCAHWGLAFACQVTALRWLSATGNASHLSGRARSLSLGARLGAELPIRGSLAALAYADLLLTPTPVRLLSEGRELWRTPLLGGGLGIALALHFP